LKEELRLVGVSFEFKDADADENQDECDYHNVDKLPHVVQINPETGDAIGEWIGDQTKQLIAALKKK
jgi:hypothetical protein